MCYRRYPPPPLRHPRVLWLSAAVSLTVALLSFASGRAASSLAAMGAGPPRLLSSDTLVVNEIDYDQPSTDAAEFVELLNVGSAGIDLDPYAVELVNGQGGAATVYRTIDLPAVTLAAGDYYVICGNAANVPECDLELGVSSNLIQNGAPDAVAVVNGSAVIDTVSYEGDTGSPYTEGSGSGLEDDGNVAALGLSRHPDGTDSDQNDQDLSLRCISPGESNLSTSSGCDTGATPTATDVPTATPTDAATPTAGPPTATNVPPTATDVPTATESPPTATDVPTATDIPPTATDSPTATGMPPTATAVPTSTAAPPTATPVPPTATDVPPTPTDIPPTATDVPPTATDVPATATDVPATATAVPATATDVPPTPTDVPPTATAVPTFTSDPPTPTDMPTATDDPPTATAVPPTATDVPPTATDIPPTVTEVPPTATAVPPTSTDVPPTATVVPPTSTDTPPTATGAPSATVEPQATATEAPLAVKLVGLTAYRVGHIVVLDWRTLMELDHTGFHVWRRSGAERPVRLTRALIPPTGGGLGGAAYRLLDARAPSGPLCYWVEDVDTRGRGTRHGPIFLPAAPPIASPPHKHPIAPLPPRPPALME